MTTSKPFKVRDRRNRGWFYLDNEYLNGLGKYLGLPAIGIYVSLCRHADNEQRCFPAQELIAEELGISNRTVIKYLNLLRKHNVIAIERERKGRKWAQNVYYLIDKSEWKYPKNHQVKSVHVNETTGSGESDDIYQVNDVHTKDTNSNNTHITIPAPQGGKKSFNPLGAEVLKEFEAVDPKNKTYYANKTQRAACDFLIEEYGFDKVKQAVAILPKINQRKLYIRQITTPFELKENWVKIGNALRQSTESKYKVAF